jgi:DNA-binding NtrC family response regulator
VDGEPELVSGPVYGSPLIVYAVTSGMPSLHLLVVGRETPARENLLTAFRGAGHRVLAVADGPAGVEALGSPGFDILVLDLGLADLSLATLREALGPSQPAEPDSLEAAERRHIALTLRHTGGNRRRAALLLGISRSTLLHKLRKYGLE